MFRNYHFSLRVMLLVLLLLTVGGASAEDDESNWYVDSISVIVLEDEPVPVILEVSGSLPDGCTQIKGTALSVDDDVITVSVFTERVGGAFTMCTEALRPVTIAIPVDLTGLEPGDYQIQLDDLSADVSLTEDLLEGATCYNNDHLLMDSDEAPTAYTNLAGGYCLVLPDGLMAYERMMVTQITTDSDVISEDAPEPVATITTRLVDAVDLGELDFDVEAGEEIDINGEDGLRLAAIPGATGERFVAVLNDNVLIIVADEGMDGDVWESLIASIQLFEPYLVDDAGVLQQGRSN